MTRPWLLLFPLLLGSVACAPEPVDLSQQIPATCADCIFPTALAAGAAHSLAVKSDGTLWAWGQNDQGQLGDGPTENRSSPARVGEDTNWKGAAAGDSHTLALKTNGTLWAWGANPSGELGDGTTTNRAEPAQIGTAATWSVIAAGSFHSLARKADGTLWAWGSNFFGQLGVGNNQTLPNPTKVGTDTNWNTIATGFGHTLALKTDGTLWAWGQNEAGQLGDGTTNTGRSSPVRVGDETDWRAIAVGDGHTLALKTSGTLWAWGRNSEGELGDGTTLNRSSQVQVGTDNDWSAVAARFNQSAALKTDGTLWVWGQDNFGPSSNGGGGPSARTNPVQVGTDTTWSNIAVGNNHTLAFKTDGTLWAWGQNESGQLGDGSGNFNSAQANPVLVGE